MQWIVSYTHHVFVFGFKSSSADFQISTCIYLRIGASFSFWLYRFSQKRKSKIQKYQVSFLLAQFQPIFFVEQLSQKNVCRT